MFAWHARVLSLLLQVHLWRCVEFKEKKKPFKPRHLSEERYVWYGYKWKPKCAGRMNNCKLTSCLCINDSGLLIFNFQRQKKPQTNKFQGSASHNMLLSEWNICRRFALRQVCNFFPPPRQIHLSFRESKQSGNYLVAVDVNRIHNSEKHCQLNRDAPKTLK